MSESTQVAIIGAGLGGLSAAISLATQGIRVTVFEQNSTPGGKATVLELDSKIGKFRFDRGPSFLTMPFVFEELFRSAGVKLNDYIKIKRMEISCLYFWRDGTQITAWADPDRLANEIAITTGVNLQVIQKYLDHSRSVYEASEEFFLKNEITWQSFLQLSFVKGIGQITKLNPFQSLHSLNQQIFSNPKAVQIFDRYATYNCSDPSRVPSTLRSISHLENDIGVYLPEGGIGDVAKAMYKLAIEKNVEFRFDIPVTRILVNHKTNKPTVTGLEVGGQELQFDRVISNLDINLTYLKLLGDSQSPFIKKRLKQEYSSSYIVFYWGVKGSYPQLDLHNILFSDNYQAEFDSIFQDHITPKDPTVYINITSKKIPGDAPAGHENWFIIITAPNNQTFAPDHWNMLLAILRPKIIQRINEQLGIDIEGNIIAEKFMTPADIQDWTGSWQGAICGTSSNSLWSAFNRPKLKAVDYNNLYFCGASVHPGCGMPVVTWSGIQVAKRLIKELPKN